MPPPISGIPVGNYGSGSGSLLGSVLGAVPVVGGILNGVTQMFTNTANRKFQHKMYNIQRADALADWNMQNEYNSPSSQMARLKAAGLNPNLVYGNGATSMATAQPRGSTPSGTSGTAPRFDVSSVLPLLMYQLKAQMQEQQIENLKTQNLVLGSQLRKNDASTENINVDTEMKRFELNLANVTRDLDIAIKQGNLKRLDIGTEIMLSQNERAAAMNAANLQIAAQRILQMRLENEMNPLRRELLQQQIRAVGLSADLREQTKKLQDRGVTWSDPVWMRVLNSVVNGTGDLQDAIGNASPGVDWKQFLKPIY